MMRLRSIRPTQWLYAVLVLAVLTLIVLAVSNGGASSHAEADGHMARSVLLFSLLCGVLAFAVLEVSKRLFAIRGLFQRAAVRRWFWTMRAGGEFERYSPPEWWRFRLRMSGGGDADFSRALRQFEFVLTGGIGGRGAGQVFDLPAPMLSAQLGRTIETVVSEPFRYSDASWWLELDEREKYNEGDARPSRRRTTGGGRSGARGQHVLGRLDSLHITMSQQWRRLVQAASVLLSGLFGLALMTSAAVDTHDRARLLLAAIILGGPISWVVRDITAGIERARR